MVGLKSRNWNWRGFSNEGSSLRASSVFGVYDGVARWIFRLLEQEQRTKNGCFEVEDLRDIAAGRLLPNKKAVQEVVKEIGTMRLTDEKQICPWDPSSYRHEVETLILTGNADPITAGGQARFFYDNGLTPGKRALIEFPGVGHPE